MAGQIGIPFSQDPIFTTHTNLIRSFAQADKENLRLDVQDERGTFLGRFHTCKLGNPTGTLVFQIPDSAAVHFSIGRIGTIFEKTVGCKCKLPKEGKKVHLSTEEDESSSNIKRAKIENFGDRIGLSLNSGSLVIVIDPDTKSESIRLHSGCGILPPTETVHMEIPLSDRKGLWTDAHLCTCKPSPKAKKTS